MRARAAEIESADRRAILRPAGYRAHEEELLEVELTVKDVAFGEAVGALEIERGEDLAGDDGAGDVGRVFGDLFYHTMAEQLAILVPVAFTQTVGNVLH